MALIKPPVKGEVAAPAELALPPAPPAPALEGAALLPAPAAGQAAGGRRMLELAPQQPGSDSLGGAAAGEPGARTLQQPEQLGQAGRSSDGEALRHEGSAAVLLASGYGGRSSQVHSRGPSHDPEVGPTGG